MTVRLGAPDRTVPVQPPAGPVLVVSAAVSRPAAAPVVLASFLPLRTVSAPPDPTLAQLRDQLARHLHLPQVVCWQVAVLAIVLTVRAPLPVLIGGIAGATVLVGLTAVRVRGRWGYELAGVWFRFQLRSRRHDLPDDTGTAPALLGLLLPGSTARTVWTGPEVALAISHPHGLTAMIRPRSLAAELIGSVPAPAALLPATDEVGVQAVFHAGAWPGTGTRLWLAVHAGRTVETMLDDELILVLHNALRRVQRALTRAGVPTEPLPEAAAFAVITELTHVTGGRNAVREDWRFLRTGRVSQACFALDGWDRLVAGQAGGLVPQLLGRTPGVAATLTLTARSADGPRSGAVLRLAATTEAAVEHTAHGLAGLLTPAGVGLTRLDGCQLPGVAATLPIGAFLT